MNYEEDSVMNYEEYAVMLARREFSRVLRAVTPKPPTEERVCVVCHADVCAPDDDTCGSHACREVWYAEFWERHQL